MCIWRAACGCPSYADICARIHRARVAAGNSSQKSVVARITVYDCFRTGRTRLNADLVAEIALALTGDPAQAQQWRERCLQANAVTASGIPADDAASQKLPATDVSQPRVQIEPRELDGTHQPEVTIKACCVEHLSLFKLMGPMVMQKL